MSLNLNLNLKLLFGLSSGSLTASFFAFLFVYLFCCRSCCIICIIPIFIIASCFFLFSPCIILSFSSSSCALSLLCFASFASHLPRLVSQFCISAHHTSYKIQSSQAKPDPTRTCTRNPVALHHIASISHPFPCLSSSVYCFINPHPCIRPRRSLLPHLTSSWSRRLSGSIQSHDYVLHVCMMIPFSTFSSFCFWSSRQCLFVHRRTRCSVCLFCTSWSLIAAANGLLMGFSSLSHLIFLPLPLRLHLHLTQQPPCSTHLRVSVHVFIPPLLRLAGCLLLPPRLPWPLSPPPC